MTTWWVGEPLRAADCSAAWRAAAPGGRRPGKGLGRRGFEFRIDRAALHQLLAFQPALAKHADGFGTVRVAGQLGESFHASAELDVTRARLFGLPLTELRAPAELVVTPATGTGQLQVRHWSARLAGGRLRGNALLHLGAEPSFQGDVVLSELDVEAISRLMSDAGRPESGRITGKIGLSGHNPALPMTYRGRVDLALSVASLVSLPVLREIDKFLPGPRAGGCSRVAKSMGRSPTNSSLSSSRPSSTCISTRDRDRRLRGPAQSRSAREHQPDHSRDRAGPRARQYLGLATSSTGARTPHCASPTIFRTACSSCEWLARSVIPGSPSTPTVAVADTAVAFFAGVLKLPLRVRMK